MADIATTNVIVEGTEIKKKRGRKPKESKVEVINAKVNIIESLNVNTSSGIQDTPTECNSNYINESTNVVVVDDTKKKTETKVDITEEQPVKKGKRGRKPKYVYSSYDVSSHNDDNVSLSQVAEDENIIVRLNITNDTLNEKNNLVSSSNNEDHPYAYNHDNYTNISNVNDVLCNNYCSETDKKTKIEGNSKTINVLNEFAEKNKNNEWPLNTSISCYWCVHRFENAPIGIPVNYKNKTFEVFGCFCSLECAAAYNFTENNSQDEMWERYQLLNMMSRHMKVGNLIKPAPPRLALKMFGGNMDIDTFRNMGKTNKLLNINFPPMTSITQQLEEINDFEINNDFKYIPVDDDRINKYKEKIIFKRNKPLVDKNKSLESSMNLKYSSN
jgi:hypothetical protein